MGMLTEPGVIEGDWKPDRTLKARASFIFHLARTHEDQRHKRAMSRHGRIYDRKTPGAIDEKAANLRAKELLRHQEIVELNKKLHNLTMKSLST